MRKDYWCNQPLVKGYQGIGREKSKQVMEDKVISSWLEIHMESAGEIKSVGRSKVIRCLTR